MKLNKITSNNRNNLNEFERNITTLNDAVKSLDKALSVLQKMNYVEANLLLNTLNFPDEGIDFQKATKLYEINLVKRALRKTKGHQTKAAKLLKIPTSTLNAIIKRHKIGLSNKS